MIPFDFQPRTRIVFGADKIDSLGQLARELGAGRALVVSDPGIVRAGHVQRGMDALAAADLQTRLFDGVQENPNTTHVDAGVEAARAFEPDLIVGLGGGSSMDCAKGINFIYTNGGQMQDYRGRDKASQPMLPMIAVPTTAGTGSETQSFALISDSETKVKMACGDKKASFRIALLDPVLTVTQPARVTALTGIDAIAHALETFVTKVRNPASLAFSREAWRLLAANFARVLDDPQNLEARSGMQLGSCFAGLAIENSMLGATHALANPLTTHYDVIHGQAIGVMLPHVIRYNGADFAHWYIDLLEVTAHSNGCPPPADGPEGLAHYIANLVAKAGLPGRLEELGIEQERLSLLAVDAAAQWTGTFNPRMVNEQELLAIYQQAF